MKPVSLVTLTSKNPNNCGAFGYNVIRPTQTPAIYIELMASTSTLHLAHLPSDYYSRTASQKTPLAIIQHKQQLIIFIHFQSIEKALKYLPHLLNIWVPKFRVPFFGALYSPLKHQVNNRDGDHLKSTRGLS